MTKWEMFPFMECNKINLPNHIYISGKKLGTFAAQEADKHGVEASAHTAIAHDPTTEIDDALMRAIGDTGADLVVMASHVPNVMDYIWPSNGGKLAEHAKCSVMVVRA